jgi:hypothetical protein
LYAVSVGVERVNMQLVTQSPFSAWQPVAAKIGVTDRPAQVLWGWYGHVFVAGVLGGTRGKLQVVEVGLGRAGDWAGSVVAYAIYHDGGRGSG